MKIRIGVGAAASAATPVALAELVKGIDDLGFDSVWLSEVLTGPVLDPVVGLAWAAAARWLPFAFDAISFAVYWVVLGRLRTDLSAPRREGPPRKPQHDVAEGIRFIAAWPYFRATACWSALANLLVNAMFFVAILRMVQDGVSPTVIGLVSTAAGVGVSIMRPGTVTVHREDILQLQLGDGAKAREPVEDEEEIEGVQAELAARFLRVLGLDVGEPTDDESGRARAQAAAWPVLERADREDRRFADLGGLGDRFFLRHP